MKKYTLEYLENEIRKDLKNLKDLQIGCKVKIKIPYLDDTLGTKEVIEGIIVKILENKRGFEEILYVVLEDNEDNIHYCHTEDFEEIIGRDILISDVFLWRKEKNKNDLYRFEVDVRSLIHLIDFNKPLLKEQNKKVIIALGILKDDLV